MSTAEKEEMWQLSINPWLMIVPVILSVFMFALDETVSNVALVYIYDVRFFPSRLKPRNYNGKIRAL